MSAHRTPAEQAVHEDIEKQIAAGGDPFGDDEEIVAPSIDSQAADAQTQLALENGETTADGADDSTTTAAAETTEGATAEDAATTTTGEATTTEEQPALSAEALAEVVNDDEDDDTPAVVFDAADRTALDTDKAKLVTEKATNLKKMMDGEMTPEDYAAADARISDALEAIVLQRSLHELNAQNVVNAEKRAVANVLERAKKEGAVDYTKDPTAAKQFDVALQMIAADPASANRSKQSLANEAHASVLALRGIAKASGTAAPATAAAATPATPAATPAQPRVPGKGPVTLRSLPEAATSHAGGGALEAIGNLTGQAYQEAYAKLTPAQKAALVDD